VVSICSVLLTSTAFTQNGTIYETNFGSNTIEVFCLTGSDLGVFGNANHATGLAFDNAGNLYVSSDGPVEYKIDKFTPDGSVSVFASGSLRCPHGLAFDKSGNLYVASPCGNTIEKFTPDGVGSEFANADDGLDQPIDLIFDGSGNLFVSNAQTGTSHTGSILKFTPDGVASVFADTGFHTAFGLAFDSDGNLYVSNASARHSTIEKFAPDGTDLGVFARAGLNIPHGMIFDAAGNLYVANSGNSTIEKFAPDGTDLGVFANTGLGPHFLALGIFTPSHLHFECEALSVQASVPYRTLSDRNASGGAYGLLRAVMPGDFVTFTVPVATAATYSVKVGIQTRKDHGIFKLAIDGVDQGTPQDEYSPATGYEVRDLGTVTLTGCGGAAFQFVVTGQNPSSRGYSLAFDYIDLYLIP
jgi:sugar lactone lactonase YvrE